jgi:hypothetical protein
MSEPSDYKTIIFKEGFLFIRNNNNNYSLSFQMENNNIVLSKIIDFNLIKLIYDLNSDIYDKINMQIINENEAIINALMKNLFEDLGLPQRFTHLRIKKTIENERIIFESQSIVGEKPPNMPINSELMPIKNLICLCDIITPHKIEFKYNILFENTMVIPSSIEKIIGMILFKILNRVKQFIENVRI